MHTMHPKANVGQHIQFRDIPAYGPESLPGIIDAVFKRRRRFWLPSYGAVLIKEAGKDGWDHSIELIQARLPRNANRRTRTNVFAPGSDAKNILRRDLDLPPHVDFGQFKNDMSTLYTDAGSAEVIEFDAARPTPRSDWPLARQINDDLFDEGLYPYEHTGHALRGMVEETDVLLFDASLVHSVRSMTPDRLSRSRYF